MDNRNLRDASAKKGKLYKLVVMSFGLLCILQATLNITLRLTIYNDDKSKPDFEAAIKNLTEEREEIKNRLNMLDEYTKQGWVYLNKSVYYISSTNKSWQDSRDDCLQREADLVIINSKEEQEFMRQFKRITWIGLTDSEKEDTWTWVDGTLLNTSYWYTAEPNTFQGRNEDCVEIKFYDHMNSWNDVECDTENFWICEKVVAL